LFFDLVEDHGNIVIRKIAKTGVFPMIHRICPATNGSASGLGSKKQRGYVRKGIVAAAMAILAILPAAATDKTDVMTTVRQFVDSFNKGDVKAASASCAGQTSILDEFPPYEWHGADACAKWMNDYDADAKKNEITDGVVTLSAPLHIDVTGDRAYVVVRANYKFKKKGKWVQETGSMLTISLQKSDASWRFTGWSWAKH
jgi:ketosteroid isomerase-like protein